MLDRTQAPKVKSAIDFEYKLQPCTKRVLNNGIPLYYINEGVQEVLQLELVFKAGLWFEPKNAIAQATASLLKSGTSSHTSYQINESLEQYGISVKIGAGTDWGSIMISGLSKHIAKILPLVFEMITDTQFPQHEIDLYIQNALQRLSISLKKSDFIANRKIDEYLFGIEHPYGKYLMQADYEAIDRDSLVNFLKARYNSKDCILFLAGKFSEDLITSIEDIFGKAHWNDASEKLIVTHKEVLEPIRKHQINHDENSVQGSIRIASPFPEKHHPDFVPMIILNTLFGGYFGSRLMSNIREDKGYTYGIHSYMYNHTQGSAYMIATEAGKDVCEATVAEVYKEMDILRNELISEEELMLVKNYLLGNLLGDLDGAFQIMQRWKNLILNDFPEQRFYDNIEIYKYTSSEKLKELAQKYYQPERFFELIVT